MGIVTCNWNGRQSPYFSFLQGMMEHMNPLCKVCEYNFGEYLLNIKLLVCFLLEIY